MTVREYTCQGCGAVGQQTTGGRPKKWCSEHCRKNTLYGGTCVDCGTRTAYTGHGTAHAERCVLCSAKHNGALKKVWTREAIIAAFRGWAQEFGEHPAIPDWNPTMARILNDEERARRYEQRSGEFPSPMTVVREFGTWNASVEAAGFVPRQPNGGGGNMNRRRSNRGRAVA